MAVAAPRAVSSRERATEFIIFGLVFLSCFQVLVDFRYYRFESFQTNALNGYVSIAGQIWCLAGSVYLLLSRAATGQKPSIRPEITLSVLTIYYLTVTFLSSGQVLTYLPTAILCLAISLGAISHQSIQRVVAVSCFIVLLSSTLFLIAFPEYSIMQVNLDRLTPFSGQVAGLTPHPNTLGLFAGVGLGMAFFFQEGSNKFRFFLGCLSTLMIVGSGSRLAYWVGFVAVAVYLMSRRGDKLTPRIRAALLSLGATVLLFALTTGFEDLFAYLNGRDKIWSEYLTYWQKNPIFGGGLDAGRNIILNALTTVTSINGGQSHNEYIGDLVRGGIIGLTLMLVFIVLLFVKFLRDNAFNNPALLFVCLALVSASFVEQVLIFTFGSRTIFTLVIFMLATTYLSPLNQSSRDKHSQNLRRNSRH